MIRWGSPDGPRIIIDLTGPEGFEVKFLNMSDRLAARIIGWVEVNGRIHVE
jgi:hypothetical protein